MQENIYRKLLDNASDLIWAIDMEGKFIYINNNISEWGYDKKELIGQPLVNILNTKHIGKRESVPSIMGFHQTIEMEILDKRGDAHKVVVKSSPLLGDDGNIIGVMGIIRDVTETQLLEEKLKNEERLASLGRLAIGIAHEIRNPLSSVKMNLSILRKRLNPAGDDVEHFEIAQEEVANLEKIVMELLDYAKPMSLNLRRQNLHTQIDAVMATMESVCKEKNVVIKKKFAENMEMILFDRMKFNQALLNILLNAVQATKTGGHVEIETRLIKKSPVNLACIIVTDFGKGIDPADLKFVFDPFFTTKKTGTGLGLSIVRNILNNHDGTVTLSSNPGQGTTATLELPVN